MNRKNMLEETAKCVLTDREQQYGGMEDNFALIAKMWEVYSGREYNAHDVAIYLAMLKIGRISSGQTKEDNYVDLAGYAACACEIATELKGE